MGDRIRLTKRHVDSVRGHPIDTDYFHGAVALAGVRSRSGPPVKVIGSAFQTRRQMDYFPSRMAELTGSRDLTQLSRQSLGNAGLLALSPSSQVPKRTG